MTESSATLQHLNTQVGSYADASDAGFDIDDHNNAMECMDCENLIQTGIDLYRRIAKFDDSVREAQYDEELDFDVELDAAIRKLYVVWLSPCDVLNAWIDLQYKRNFEVDNLSDFRKCVSEVKSIVASFEQEADLPERFHGLVDAAIREHKSGETSEFI